MFSSLYSALSGMVGFSKGLDVVSNNVANMNTPGFKASELQFRDLFYQYSLGGGNQQIGQGLDTGATRTNYRQGDLRETSSPTDLAIDGNGFFVLRKDGDVFYTRSGRFEFDDQGLLVDIGTGARVAAYNGVTLTDISRAGLRTNPLRPTSEVRFTNTLSHGSATASHQVDNVSIVDATGATRTLTVQFNRGNQATLDTQSELLVRTESRTTFTLNQDVLSTTRNVTRVFEPQVATYTVPAGVDWQDVAAAVYGPEADRAEAGNALQAQMILNGVITLEEGAELSNFPAQLSVSLSETVDPYYDIRAEDTSWTIVAERLYGHADLVEELAAEFDIDTATPPDAAGEIEGPFPATLESDEPIEVEIDPYYVVREGDDWDSIARALYGSAFGAELQDELNDPTLTPGAELRDLPATLTLSTPNVFRWTIEVREGQTVLSRGEVRFAGTGDPLPEYESVQLDFSASGMPSRIAFDFSGAQSLSGGSTSSLTFAGHDGIVAGSLIETTFDADGVMNLRYSNGQTATHDRLALAWFDDLQSLTLVGDSLFVAAEGQTPTLGTANANGLGRISAGHIELSNVELTEQFTDIVILQRGYQASSQVISVANEMAQQLMDLRNRR